LDFSGGDVFFRVEGVGGVCYEGIKVAVEAVALQVDIEDH